MKIVHVATEMAPFAKVGGLGDVVHGLSKEQLKDHQVEVIIPGYTFIDEVPSHVTLLGKYDAIYGTGEVERFAHFCDLVQTYLEDESFDVLHLHDWPTSMLAPLVHGPRKILTIHNCHHQGKCQAEQVEPLPLPIEQMRDLRDPDRINLLKGGILYSDAVVAVSPTYAKEILTQTEGDGLDPILNEHQHKVSGILNGIDTDYWNPETDPYLVYHYSPLDPLDGKASNKQHLLSSLNLAPNQGPLVCAITRLVPQKGLDLIEETMIHTLANDGQFLLLGSSPCPDTQAHFERSATMHKCNRLHCHFAYDEKFAHMVYSAADAIVIPSRFEPCGLTQMIAMRYGTVPIARATGGLVDTVTPKNGFLFSKPAELKPLLNKVFSTYCDTPKTWHTLMHEGATRDSSWHASAAEYEKLYTAP